MYGKPELERERLGDLFFRGEVHADEHHAEPLARTFVFGQCRAQIVVGDEARLNQALTDFFAQPHSSP